MRPRETPRVRFGRFPAWRDAPDWEKAPRLYRGIHRFAYGWHAGLTRIRLRGRENVPREGGLIVAANHFSWDDPIVVSNVVPRPVGWLAKKELWAGPVTSRFFDAGGCIPVDRRANSNAQAVQAALEALGDGRVVGLFPEGTRSEPGKLLPPKGGVARLAFLSGCPVLPIGVASDRFWGKGTRLPRFGEPVYVAIGEPVTYDHGPEAAEDRALVGKVADDVMTRIGGLVDEAIAARDAGEKWA